MLKAQFKLVELLVDNWVFFVLRFELGSSSIFNIFQLVFDRFRSRVVYKVLWFLALFLDAMFF